MSSNVIASSKFILIGSIISKIISFVGSIFLARILFPEDYGYLTFTTVFTVFLQQIGNFGIEVFYLQEKTESQEEEEGILQTVFKLRLFVNGALFILQNGIALVCFFYLNKPIVSQLLFIFSFTYIFETISSVNGAMLKKELNFKPIAIANTLRDVTSVIARVGLAALGWGPLCFGVGAVIGSFCQTVVIIRFKRMAVKWKFWNKHYFLRVYHFSKHVLFGSIGAYASQQVDKLLMISFFDVSKIGFYSFGYSNAGIPFTYVFSPQQQLILSYSANLKNKPDVLLTKIFEMGRIIILLTGPMYVLAYFNCEYIISTLFGLKWLAAAAYVKLFIIYFFFLSFLTPFNGLLTALGRPDIISYITLVKFIVLVPVLLIFSLVAPDLINYCLSFSVVSILFDLAKAQYGVKRIGGSVFSFLVKNSDVVILLVILCLGGISILSFAKLKAIEMLVVSVVCVLAFWAYFLVKEKDRSLLLKLFGKK